MSSTLKSSPLGDFLSNEREDDERLLSHLTFVTKGTVVDTMPSYRRKPSLARRTYQAGSVFQKGKTRSDQWEPTGRAYLRFWKDVPGEANARRQYAALGVCRTRSIAERRAAELLGRLGINSTRRIIEATSSIFFRRQAEIWLKSLSQRKRNPLEQATIDTRRYALDKWIHPFFAGKLVAEITNRSIREFVEHIGTLSASTIRDYSNIVKAVVASAIDENGEEVFPRKWNEEYIDAPLIGQQRQPSLDPEKMEAVIRSARGQFRMLYHLLAGCGPLRVGEALGLDISNISENRRTLRICQKAKRGKIQPYLKTAAGERARAKAGLVALASCKTSSREVDLCTDLSNALRGFIGSRRTGLLFATAAGRQLLQSNTLQDSLHPILKKLEVPKGGFNIFRRFRITHVAKSECPEFLRHFWSGHAQKHSERYIKLLGDPDFRLQWAEKIGTGFTLQKICE
jgi:integrase